jgi:hypothetical protein
MGFEPTILAFQLAKTVHDLDRAATVIGVLWIKERIVPSFFFCVGVYLGFPSEEKQFGGGGGVTEQVAEENIKTLKEKNRLRKWETYKTKGLRLSIPCVLRTRATAPNVVSLDETRNFSYILQ